MSRAAQLKRMASNPCFGLNIIFFYCPFTETLLVVKVLIFVPEIVMSTDEYTVKFH